MYEIPISDIISCNHNVINLQGSLICESEHQISQLGHGPINKVPDSTYQKTETKNLDIAIIL